MPTLTLVSFNGLPLANQTLTPSDAGKLLTYAGDTPGREVVSELWVASFHALITDGKIPAGMLPGIAVLKTRYRGAPGTGDIPPSIETRFAVKAVSETNSTGSISGTLWNDDDADGVRDVGEKPTDPGRAVFIDTNGDGVFRAGEPSTISGQNGQFTISGLPEGTHNVCRVFPAGYRLSNPDAVGKPYRTVKLASGEHATGVDLGTTNRPMIDTSQPSTKPAQPPASTTGETEGSTAGSAAIKMIKGACDLVSLGTTTMLTTDKGQETAIDYARRIGINGERAWLDFTGHETSFTHRAALFSLLAAMLKMGFTIVVACATELYSKGLTMPTAEQTTVAATALFRDARAAGLDPTKVIWEVGNEPNYSLYWRDTLKAFVDRVGNPFYRVAHALGAKVCTASVTGSVDGVKQLIDAGVLGDYLGFHPYRTTAGSLDVMLSELRAVAPGWMILLTEWNVFLGANYRAWLVLQSHPEIDPGGAWPVILPMIRKFDPKAALPAVSPDDIKQRQRDSIAVIKKHGAVADGGGIAGYFYFLWKDAGTPTSPLAIISNRKPTTFAQAVNSF